MCVKELKESALPSVEDRPWLDAQQKVYLFVLL